MNDLQTSKNVRLTYELGNNGWAEIVFEQGEQKWGVPVSYLHNTLSDLIRSAHDVYLGSQEEIFLIDSEGYTSLVSLKKDTLSIILDPEQDGDEKREVFLTKLDISQYCMEVIRVAQLILDTYGMESYQNKWLMHPFPLERLNTLKEATVKDKKGLSE